MSNEPTQAVPGDDAERTLRAAAVAELRRMMATPADVTPDAGEYRRCAAALCDHVVSRQGGEQ